MADFSNIEKTNANWKHLFGILPTSNAAGADGRFWYEEKIAATHVVISGDIWANAVPLANNISEARAAAGAIVEDRSSGENITLTASGSDWLISTSGIIPKIGFQLTDTHPSPTYIKSLTNVVDLGSNNYLITLNNNSGVSAGSAVLQGRIFLTEDIATNGLAWFVKSEVGNIFSTSIENFIQSHRFGHGYSIRVFQNNGTEIFTTQGAWIFNWQKGLLLLGQGYTADDLGYSKPLYIEGFRYTGAFGTFGNLTPGVLNHTLRFNGTDWEDNSALQSDSTDVSILNKLTISGALVVFSGLAPANSNSPGSEGEVRYDSKFVYIFASGKWRRSGLTLF